MESRRILMISTHGYVAAEPELGKPDTGGQVVYVLEVSKALASFGFQVDILTRQFEEQPAFEDVASGVRIVRIPYSGSRFRSKETLFNYVPDLVGAALSDPYLRQTDYSLINSHYWDAGVAGVRFAKLWGVTHVHTPHSMGLLKRKNRAWGPAGNTDNTRLQERIRCEREIYHHCDLVVATAGEQTRCLQESDEYNVPEEKIVQIAPGYDASLFHPLRHGQREFVKQLYGWSVPTIFAAGRLDVSKGYDLLIRAFPRVLQRIDNAQLVLAIGGDQPTTEEARFLAQLRQQAETTGIGNKVKFLPCVRQSQLADYYRAADVFVLCSRNEPFGMTALESMACGTPTVVTTRGGLWEQLSWGQDCICCDPTDSEALAQSICSPLLNSRIRKRLSLCGATTARTRYTWNQVASQMLDSFAERNWTSTDTNTILTDTTSS